MNNLKKEDSSLAIVPVHTFDNIDMGYPLTKQFQTTMLECLELT